MTTMTESIIVEPVVSGTRTVYHVLHVVDRPIKGGRRRTVIRTLDTFSNKALAEFDCEVAQLELDAR